MPLLVHPFDNPRRLFARFHPFARWLSNDTHDVQLSLLASYQEQLDRITCKKHPNLAYLGPTTFYLAQQVNPNIQPLAMETINNKTHFRALLLTKAREGETNSVFNLIGKKLATGDELSLGSTLYPLYLLKQLGITTAQLAQIEGYKNHDQILQALLHDQVDYGSVREDIANTYLGRGLSVVHQSPPLPPHILVASEKVPKALCESLIALLTDPLNQSAFVSLGTQRGFTHYETSAYEFMPQLFSTLSEIPS
ncbi:MAG: PhnD/SsuA/transferrin family substrate-binding protein [Gammaproteobacteria bacterium]|nr:PhnD/SsuA/transferrin family substrate-binding protein [Gammaproteobacteria bacterium]